MALVRVRANGWEFNVGANYAAAKGLAVVDAPTHRQDGRTRRPEPVRDGNPKTISADTPTDSPADAEEEQAEPTADNNDESASEEEIQ